MNPPSDLAVIGPGRAGGALAIAALEAGYRVQTVPGPSGTIPSELEHTRVARAVDLSPCSLLILASPDDAIEELAASLANLPPPATTVAHLSGFASIAQLRSLERTGMQIGCLHPLQTLPTPQQGAEALAGSAAAVTARTEEVAQQLSAFAETLGMVTFRLDDDLKPLYHAGAAIVALGLVTSLGVAADLFEKAGVPWRQARSLANQVMDNCFQLGPDQSLTGPLVRADLGTITGHLEAAAAVSPNLVRQYQMLAHIAAFRFGAQEVAQFLDIWQASPGLPQNVAKNSGA